MAAFTIVQRRMELDKRSQAKSVSTFFVSIYQYSLQNKLFVIVVELFIADPPEVNVLRSWVNSGEGLEAKLDCVVHADPQAEVVNQLKFPILNFIIALTFHFPLTDVSGTNFSDVLREGNCLSDCGFNYRYCGIRIRF